MGMFDTQLRDGDQKIADHNRLRRRGEMWNPSKRKEETLVLNWLRILVKYLYQASYF